MISKVFLHPYKNKDGQYQGLPKDFNIDNLTFIGIKPNEINKVSEFNYNWLKVHPEVIEKQYQFEII